MWVRVRVAAVRPSDWAASAGAGTKCVHEEMVSGGGLQARERRVRVSTRKKISKSFYSLPDKALHWDRLASWLTKPPVSYIIGGIKQDVSTDSLKGFSL